LCYHKSLKAKLPEVSAYYNNAKYSDALAEQYKIHFHENGYDFLPSPILTAEKTNELILSNWGFIPSKMKDKEKALKLRASLLNAKIETIQTTIFKDAFDKGQRCLVPASGFYEFHHYDKKTKVPYYIHLKDQPIFSFAGVYDSWTDPETNITMNTYTLLTTSSIPGSFISKIHNSVDRRVVIIPKQFEVDFLNANLSYEDVQALCNSFNGDDIFDAYTVDPSVKNSKVKTDYEDILRPVPFVPEPPKEKKEKPKDIQGSLF
jgi:putative SOS response-associated peptidase YedK